MAARDRVAAIVIGVLVAALLALGWFCWAVLRQNGRLLMQLDARATAAASLDLPPLAAGEPAPDFAAATLDGDAVSLSSLLAPSLPVALVFADGHCGACEQVLAEAAKADGDRATVAVVMRGDGAAAREKASALRLPLVIGDPDDAVFGAFRVRGAPGTLLLDPEGRVAKPGADGLEPGPRRAGLRRRGRAGRDRHGGCRMSAAADQLKRIYPALQQSIDQGAFGFADACSAISQAEQSGTPASAVASPAMATAVATWQGNVNMALDRVNATSSKARGRALALQTWQALATALTQLSQGMSMADAAAGASLIEQGQANLATYHSWPPSWRRRCDERHRAALAGPSGPPGRAPQATSAGTPRSALSTAGCRAAPSCGPPAPRLPWAGWRASWSGRRPRGPTPSAASRSASTTTSS